MSFKLKKLKEIEDPPNLFVMIPLMAYTGLKWRG